MTDQEWTPCEVCGARREPGAPSDDGWLGFEVERVWAPGAWQAVVVCSPEHAAAWFSPPMRAPDFHGAPVVQSRAERWRGLVATAVGVISVVAVLALAVWGAVCLLR